MGSREKQVQAKSIVLELCAASAGCLLVYCCMLGGAFSESLAGQRLARREPPKNAMTALQRLTRE